MLLLPLCNLYEEAFFMPFFVANIYKLLFEIVLYFSLCEKIFFDSRIHIIYNNNIILHFSEK